MAGLGPFVPEQPGLPVGVAVSGGADSVCLALLTRRWRRAVIGFVVDHGLRAGARGEAELTCARLEAMGVEARLLSLRGLPVGSRLQERARQARYEVLERAAVAAGCVDLLVGHHERDQVETGLIRERAGTGARGLACMASVREDAGLRIVRPLLGVAPERLRARLRAEGVEWVDDPSNENRRFERVRFRQDARGEDEAVLTRVRGAGVARVRSDREEARVLAAGVSGQPGGWFLLPEAGVGAGVLAGLIQCVTGASYRVAEARLEAFCRAPHAMTIGGACLVRAGRFGAGWILARESAAVQGAVAAEVGTVWDGRFVVRASGGLDLRGAVIAPLAGAGAEGFPAVVRKGLPGVWRNGVLLAAFGDEYDCLALFLRHAGSSASRWGN